jgi:hypothetical protein
MAELAGKMEEGAAMEFARRRRRRDGKQVKR